MNYRPPLPIYNPPNISFLSLPLIWRKSRSICMKKHHGAQSKAKQQLLETQEAFKAKVKRVSKPLVIDLTVISHFTGSFKKVELISSHKEEEEASKEVGFYKK